MATTDLSLAGRYGSLLSWARTVDRTARTANGRAAAMGRWEREVRADPAFAEATEAQILAAVEAKKRAFFTDLARRSVKARAAKQQRRATAG